MLTTDYMRLYIFALVLSTFTSFGQIPAGYYDAAAGLTGQPLRAALCDIIDDHEEQTYQSIWTHFQYTDVNPNGMVWDMYSDIPGGNPAYLYTFFSDQCGNYAAEGDCYNREHSFPKSWFNDASPMVTDLFHIYPTDGYVNGKRNNYPYGEVGNASWNSTNGSKVGVCSFTGYSGIVFEPIDEYKGDFARTYFYMMTRYMSLIASWSSDMLSGNDLAFWAKEMLLEWDENDPVSQKETDRNNSVYQIQNNRNPFIDHPEFTDLIWGTSAGINRPKKPVIKFWYNDETVHLERSSSEIGKVMILNILGQPLVSWQIAGNYLNEHLKLQSGVYLLVLESNKEYISGKLLISK
jgi:endonuclease I